jgi:hypothetical protein
MLSFKSGNSVAKSVPKVKCGLKGGIRGQVLGNSYTLRPDMGNNYTINTLLVKAATHTVLNPNKGLVQSI